MQRDMMFHSLYQALSRDHCAICHLGLESVHKFLWGFLYEGVNDPWFRAELIKARGFCPVHAWNLAAFLNSNTGVAIVYRHLLEEFRSAFRAVIEQQAVTTGGRRWFPWSGQAHQEAARSVRSWLEPQLTCPACRQQRGAEDRYTAAAARGASDADFRARYESSLGLCLPHQAAVLEQTADGADLEWLVQAEQRLIDGLIYELSEFWRKHDYRFHGEPFGGEATSWRRVLHKMAGAPGIVWR